MVDETVEISKIDEKVTVDSTSWGFEIRNAMDKDYNSNPFMVRPQGILLQTRKPYLVNPMYVECAIGEWNKDKGEYGVRVYFASGKDLWLGGDAAAEFLGDCNKAAREKFKTWIEEETHN